MPAKIVKGETPSVRFTSVAEDAFPVLAKMKGDLELEFVTVLSDEAAKALSQHKGFLSLMGLDESSLSANAVKSLLKHDGPVVFEPPNFE